MRPWYDNPPPRWYLAMGRIGKIVYPVTSVIALILSIIALTRGL